MVHTVFDPDQSQHLERLSAPATVYYLVCTFEGEVINGGFSQFFSNSSGTFSQETVQALRRSTPSVHPALWNC
jgi:hypothetical protein